MRQIKKGSTNISVELFIIDSTDGTPELGVLWNTAGIDLNYRRDGAVVTSITEATLAALTTAHTDGGFLHVANGRYRLDVPDAAFATGVSQVTFGGTVTGMVVMPVTFQLVNFDPDDATRMGLTALPNAAANAANGLPISIAGSLDLDAKLANTNEITVARMGVLTDWIDGGRLDLLIDAILLDTETTFDGKIDTVVDAVKVQTDKLLFDASDFVKTAVNDIIIAALAKFMTVDSGETTAVAGSVAKIAQGAAGGSVDVATFSGAASTKVDAIKAKTDTIGFGTVTVTSPVALDQNVTLVKGDDYNAADGRALDFINATGTGRISPARLSILRLRINCSRQTVSRRQPAASSWPAEPINRSESKSTEPTPQVYLTEAMNSMWKQHFPAATR
jgi:hypothetical protein